MEEISSTLNYMQSETIEIATKVRGVAAEFRATQQSVADTLQLNRGAVSQRFNGVVPFSGPELLALSRRFNVPVTRFFPEAVSS